MHHPKLFAGLSAFVPCILSLELDAQTLTLDLVPSDHNGYGISCFGGGDGAVDLTVSGGTAPYSYLWSTGALTEDVADLRAGYVTVIVKDAVGIEGRGEITLTEPDAMKAELVPYKYASGYNISCFNCFNGSIDLTVHGGASPFTYEWYDGPTTQDRSALGSANYGVNVVDANGCAVKSEEVYLNEPERDDWTRSGNAGTDPATQYIGTSDNKDVVFKANGQEGLRLKADGGIKIFGGSTMTGPLYRDTDGTLRAGGPPNLDPMPLDPCALTLGDYPYWETDGNSFQYPQCPEVDVVPILGTRSPHPVYFITDDETRMILTVDGKLGIGTEPPSGPIDEYRLYVEDGIVTRDVLVKLGDWPDHVFADNYKLMSLSELRDYLRANHHLPGIPSAADVEKKSGVEVGDLQKRMLQVVEEQALYILQLETRLAELEQRFKAIEGSQR